MTDKQIIDGKECRYWFRYNTDDYRKCSLRGKDDNCDEIKDCFVKELLGKLAQKEQECEELNTMLKDLSYENQKFCYQIEEQTKQLEPFKDEYFKDLDNIVIAKLAKKSIRITAENSKLEQTLTNIKEIAKNAIKNVSDMCIETTPMYGVYKQILQKISEVGNGN